MKLLLVGLWGGCRKCNKDKLTELMKEMLKWKPIHSWDYDQAMLRRIVWPEINDNVVSISN